MEKKIIIGGRNFGRTELLRREIEKVLEKQGSVVIASKEDVKYISGKEYFDINCLNEPMPIQEPIFDKPKSKYHK